MGVLDARIGIRGEERNVLWRHTSGIFGFGS